MCLRHGRLTVGVANETRHADNVNDRVHSGGFMAPEEAEC